MAIRRCPYCKAIIDEQDKYCDNCGTQLLFPEDEFIEEDIPGDKIIGDEEPEEEEEDLGEEKEMEEELEEEEELAKDEDKEEEDHEEEDYEEKEERAEEEELEAKAEEAGGKEETGEFEGAGDEAGISETLEKEAAEDYELTEESQEEQEKGEAWEGEVLEEAAVADRLEHKPLGVGEIEEAGRQAEPEFEKKEESLEENLPAKPEEPAAGVSVQEESGKKYEVSIEKDELVFKTKDLESLTKTVDEGKKEIEELIESHPRFEKEDLASEAKDTLPPWVSQIKETPAMIEAEPEEAREKLETGPQGWTADSGIGIPEKITQAALPYGDTGIQEIAKADKEHEDVEGQEEETTGRREEAGRPAALALRLKAKFVDWVFVTALWLISLWFTAQVVGVSFFRLLFGSPIPVLAFYVILLVLYFFLFLYFLGETLGDHYFLEED